jgi:hypothetical protein
VYGSWGHFTQAQRPEEWRIDGSQGAPDLAELAIQSALGVAFESAHQTRLGLEVYRKRWTHVSPYYDNTLEKLTLVPDLTPDRVLVAPAAAVSEGVELSARKVFSASVSGWATYTWSHAVDDFSPPEASVLRSWDEPHALTSGLTWARGPLTAETVVGWHRGWPRTPFTFVPGEAFSAPLVVLGPRNSARWGNFFTLDLRASWSVPTAHGDLSVWAESLNSTDRRNPCCSRFLAPDTLQVPSITQADSWFPRSYDLGFTWRFHPAH